MSIDSIDKTTDAPVVEEQTYQYPGTPTTCDGAEAVVWVETNICQGSGAYPITSSTTMGSGFNAARQNGIPNLWGDELVFVEPESEHSAATFCEGFALAGGRVTNFTSGQGLVLMKEVLYTISGKRLPAVFNIGSRALTSQSLNVHAGHDDVMSVADCGWGILFGRNAQEAQDLCLISRRAAEASCTPFMNVQDGFLTTHTVETVRLLDKEFMKDFVGKPEDKIMNIMGTENPLMSGVVQNQDSYMKGKIAQRWYYDQVEPAIEEALVYDQGTLRLKGRPDSRLQQVPRVNVHYKIRYGRARSVLGLMFGDWLELAILGSCRRGCVGADHWANDRLFVFCIHGGFIPCNVLCKFTITLVGHPTLQNRRHQP
jgi:pyruvate-ferredoxin/flavodoxin oxidoreductase